MTVIKKKTFSYLSHNRKSGTIAGLLAQFGRIGRAKGVETYFAFNPFCEKKKRKTGTMEWPFHQFPLLRWTTEKGLSPSTIFTDA